jgi:hypothetical protein
MNQNPYNPRPDLSQQMFGNQFPNQYRPVGWKNWWNKKTLIFVDLNKQFK